MKINYFHFFLIWSIIMGSLRQNFLPYNSYFKGYTILELEKEREKMEEKREKEKEEKENREFGFRKDFSSREFEN